MTTHKHRRSRRNGLALMGFGIVVLATAWPGYSQETAEQRPNILFSISDDQSWPHASAYGCQFVDTPAFDRVAREGVLFHNAFAPAPQCSPCRASILSGRNPWENGDAAVHGTTLPLDIPIYTELLEQAGYHVGHTGKGWAPGPVKREHNPAGKHYGSKGYAGAFRSFLATRKPGQPFCFWYGSHEPHRGYVGGSGLKAGKTLASVDLPGYLPDRKSVRSDFLDYALEIERFDQQLGEMLDLLESNGELDNTVVVVTSDNGMPWPRAKANLYEHGVHMPLAIRWGRQVAAGREVTDPVSLVDLAPTFLDAAGVNVPAGMSGKSLLNILKSTTSGRVDPSRTHVVFGMERHTPYIRANDVGYPARGIRTESFLYIRNFKPDRWPAGDTFYDGMGPSPIRDLLLDQSDDPQIQPFVRLAFAKRPDEELYDIQSDPDCVKNLIDEPDHADTAETLRARLTAILQEQNDPRIMGDDHYDTIEYFKTIWKQRRLGYLAAVQHVHKNMEAAGWHHGEILPPPTANQGH